MQSTEADLIIMGLGANDSFQISKPKKWKQDLVDIIAHVRKNFGKVPIVFINTPPMEELPALGRLLRFFLNRQMSLLRDELYKVTRNQKGLYFIKKKLTCRALAGKYKLKYDSISDFYSDGVHPSKLTYNLWAKEIFEFIQEKNLTFVARPGVS